MHGDADGRERRPGGSRLEGVPDPALLREIREGLSQEQKELSPKFFYDHRGSELFERITALPEYYLTRAERDLLEETIPHLFGSTGAVPEIRPEALVELGAGSSAKTRIILDAMLAAGTGDVYAPVDISRRFLEQSAEQLRSAYPDLKVVPVTSDISIEMRVPSELPRPALFAFLGSTIGNFTPEQARALLRRVAAVMTEADRFLLGVDLRKHPAVIEAAYNDAEGVTAEFNRNMLRVLNARAGANFDPEAFSHLAFYDEELHRVEMHLRAERDQTIVVPGAGEWTIRRGETIRTEISCKHDRGSVEAMLDPAGMRLRVWETDPEGRYALGVAALA